MKTLKKRLEELKSKNPYLSTYILLAEAITKTKYTGDTRLLIDFFIDKDDYSKSELNGLAQHLKDISETDIVCQRKKRVKSPRRDF